MKKRVPDEKLTTAVEETLRLYHAWLAYLIRRLGETSLRVPADEIRRALEELSCSVSREGDAYVITLDEGAREAADGADE